MLNFDKASRFNIGEPLFSPGHAKLSAIRETQDAANYSGDPLPVFGFGIELLTARLGDGIKLGFSIVFGGAPGAGDPALVHQADQRGVNCALIDLQRFLADLFDAAGNSVTMLWAHGVESFQDH